MISTFRKLCARAKLELLIFKHCIRTTAPLLQASSSRHHLSVSALLAEPAGYRVTLHRPRLLRSPLVLRSRAHASHAEALQALKDQYKALTGSPYRVQRGDMLTAENPPRTP